MTRRTLLGLMPALAMGGESEVWTFNRLDEIGGLPARVLGRPKVVDGPGGAAIEFNGVDDAIFLDRHPLAGAETFTWEVVFRPDGDGPAEQRFFHLQEKDPRTGANTQVRMLMETRIVERRWTLDSFVYSTTGSRALLNRERRHEADRWQHAAMAYDGTHFRNWVNGELEGEAAVAFAPQRAGHASIGVRIDLRDHFKGAIRLARFTRRALRPSEFLRAPA